MIKQVILIGGHIQALGLARQARSIDVPVILFIEDKFAVARFSKAVSKTVVFESMDYLDECLAPYQNTGTLLFPTADQYVDYLCSNYVSLSHHFLLGIPQKETVELFGDKRKTYKFALNIGISHPLSWYPESFADVADIAMKAAFPLVVKPAIMHTFHRLFRKKAFRCDNEEELLAKCDLIQKKMPLSGIIIQEFLSGGAKTLYSYGAFVVDGEPKAWIMANRIRQNPMDFGNSTTFAVVCHIPEIEVAAKEILNRTCYSGLAEVEFMYDEPSKSYKFLEVNTRAWKWHSISIGLGFGFFSEMIKYMNQQPGDFNESNKNMAWVERLTDLTIIAKETLKGKMSLLGALNTYRQKKVSAVWSWNDPVPGLMYLILSPVLFFKRY